MSINSSKGARSLAKAVLNPVLRLARRFGVYVTRDPDWMVYETHLRRVLSAFRINCVLDVGAFHGDFARLLRHIGYAGLIISFEPVATNYEIMEEARIDDTKWRIHRMALGSIRGRFPIKVFAGTTFHSFLPPSEFGLSRFPDKLQLEGTETVPVERLDNLLDDLLKDVDNPHILLKVDTQGYDLEVIRGLGSRVSDISALQIEMAVTPLYKEATNSFSDALSYLEGVGFQVSGLFPVSFNSGDRVQVVEFDCLLCRPEKLDRSSQS